MPTSKVIGGISFPGIYIVDCSDYIRTRVSDESILLRHIVSYLSNGSKGYKQNLIKEYIRAMLVHTSNVFLQREFCRLSEILEAHMYPTCLTYPLIVSVFTEALANFKYYLSHGDKSPRNPLMTYGLLT